MRWNANANGDVVSQNKSWNKMVSIPNYHKGAYVETLDVLPKKSHLTYSKVGRDGGSNWTAPYEG